MAYGVWTIEGRSFVRMICGDCGVEFYFPESLNENNLKLGPKGTWYCPNGHGRHYSESLADTLRRERDRLQQRLAEKDDDIQRHRERAERLERRVSAAKGQVTRLKNRASKGVCPCCNRHFTDLERHMHTKHPGFVAEPTADELVVN